MTHLSALAGRSAIEAFCSAAETRISELDRAIDAGYRRLARRGPWGDWGAVEALEVEREEIILRLDEAFAMLEYQQDACHDGQRGYYDAVYEPHTNPRTPLPHGWESPGSLARGLTIAERKAQGWPESREDSLCAFVPERYVFGARVAS